MLHGTLLYLILFNELILLRTLNNTMLEKKAYACNY